MDALAEPSRSLPDPLWPHWVTERDQCHTHCGGGSERNHASERRYLAVTGRQDQSRDSANSPGYLPGLPSWVSICLKNKEIHSIHEVAITATSSSVALTHFCRMHMQPKVMTVIAGAHTMSPWSPRSAYAELGPGHVTTQLKS